MRLSKLDGRLAQMPSDERFVLIDAFARTEAVHSSRIEGINTDIGSTYKNEKEAVKDPALRSDLQEVKNYKEALEMGLNEIEKGNGISLGLVLRMHSTLMHSVRGAEKMPGSIRDGPVKVGQSWDSFEEALFVPPLPSQLNGLMADLFEYIQNGSGNPLLDVALVHYQFEIIHPFFDGNGRVGRLLMMLMLKKSDIMDHPILYLSEYINRRRKKYSLILFEVSSKGSFGAWLEYFLEAIDSQVVSASITIDKLSEYRRYLYKVSEGNEKLRQLCDMLFENPYIRVKDVKERLNVTDPTAQKLINILFCNGILIKDPDRRRGRMYKAEALLGILSEMNYEELILSA
jgi:Fic family protein